MKEEEDEKSAGREIRGRWDGLPALNEAVIKRQCRDNCGIFLTTFTEFI